MLHNKPNVNRTDGPRPKTKRLDRAREIMRLRHDSIRTERSYIHWMRRYILFHDKRHPQDMGPAEIEAFLTHLAVQGKVARSTQNQAFNALLFLYREVLGISLEGPSPKNDIIRVHGRQKWHHTSN